MEWRWTNWCGGDVQVRLEGAAPGGPQVPSARPACTDPSKPSQAQGGGVGGVGGAGGPAGRIVG